MTILLSFPIEQQALPALQVAISLLVPTVQFHWFQCETPLYFSLDASNARQQLGLLTSKERQILNRLAGNQSIKAIAAESFLSVHTVNNHARKIYRKLGVGSRTGAIAVLLQGEYGYSIFGD